MQGNLWWDDIPPCDQTAYTDAMQELRALMKVWVRGWMSRRSL